MTNFISFNDNIAKILSLSSPRLISRYETIKSGSININFTSIFPLKQLSNYEVILRVHFIEQIFYDKVVRLNA